MKRVKRHPLCAICGAPITWKSTGPRYARCLAKWGRSKQTTAGSRTGMCIRHLCIAGRQAYSENVLEFSGPPLIPPTSPSASWRHKYRAHVQSGESFPNCVGAYLKQEYEAVQDRCEREGSMRVYQEISQLDGSFCIDFTKRKDEADSRESKLNEKFFPC